MISALTHTLLPEPVAPAMSRCGMRARSTAYALPRDVAARARRSACSPRRSCRASSSSCLKATTSLEWLGISMPTTSRPGMGASIRIERAARAMARSSASPSMRESFMRASGLTSYWVTTGPVLVAVTLAGIWKLASFSSMILMLRAWSRCWPRGRNDWPDRAGRNSGQLPDTLGLFRAESSVSVIAGVSARAVAVAPCRASDAAGPDRLAEWRGRRLRRGQLRRLQA